MQKPQRYSVLPYHKLLGLEAIGALVGLDIDGADPHTVRRVFTTDEELRADLEITNSKGDPLPAYMVKMNKDLQVKEAARQAAKKSGVSQSSGTARPGPGGGGNKRDRGTSSGRQGPRSAFTDVPGGVEAASAREVRFADDHAGTPRPMPKGTMAVSRQVKEAGCCKDGSQHEDDDD